MHRGLCFAHGIRLKAACLDIITSDRWEVTYYQSDDNSLEDGLAPIHFLNQQPFIEALIRRFEDPKPFPDMLWTATGWLTIKSTTSEARFMMCMTALETIAKHLYQEKHIKNVKLFQKIKALRNHYRLPESVFTDKIIEDVIKARNNIVHEGVAINTREILPLWLFVREFISMIVFHEIGYTGPYESYVNGYRTIHPNIESHKS